MAAPDSQPKPRNADATRRSILDAARTLFARDGYGATTVKRIADAAGVSPNLITRYFGGKDGLFVAAAQTQIATGDVFTGELSGFGDRLAASIVRRWFDPNGGEDPLLVLLRSAGEHPAAAETLAQFLDENSLEPLERYLIGCGLDPADARSRAAAIDVLVVGLSARRRILRSELGDPDSLRGWLSAAIQRLASAD